jgi:hypothetical protein
MSEDPEKSKSTSHKAELEIIWEHYGRFVNEVEYDLRIEVMNEKCDIKKKPGIYKLEPKNRREEGKPELYVGEAQNLLKRLNDYKNAGYNPKADREYTNRRIQGWIHCLNSLENSIKGFTEIFVCTEAPYLCQDGKKLQLDLGGETNGKYNRELIEHMEIAIRANDFCIQNDPCNWERNKGKC